MKFISKFQGFESLNEATLDATKDGIDYILSRTGRNSIAKFGVTEDMTLTYSRKKPPLNQEVIWIRKASITTIKFKNLLEHLNQSGSLVDRIMVYQTSSKNFPWAVAEKGIRTTMVRQKLKVGAAKRGEHFRETAFIITLAIEAWRMKRAKLKIASNRGFIEMDYNRDGTANIAGVERGAFRREYDQFMDSNPSAVAAMKDQCVKLITKYLKNNITNISYVIKNTNDLLINQAATTYLKDEIGFSKDIEPGKNDYDVLNLPARLSLAKWNPSDIWIVFKGVEWTMEDFEGYENNDITSIDDLNSFLMSSILGVDGLIGVSLKQGSDVGILSIVNADVERATHRYDGYEMSGDKKTVTIDFSYKFGNKATFTGGSQIQCRTFDRTNKSNVSLEVKGSNKAKHMSGKAGSILLSLMSPEYYDIKEFIRTSTDKQEIANKMRRFRFKENDLKEIFYDDINTGTIKTADQNSRMQSIIILEWLESLKPNEANKVISNIVKFAKSESAWSAPHLLAK